MTYHEILSVFKSLGITILFHGTTKVAWAAEGLGELYLTSNFNDASVYAEEAGESEWDDEVHHEHFKPVPVVMSFSASHAALLMSGQEVTAHPDWGWVRGLENDMKASGSTLKIDPSWAESLQRAGSFCLAGFSQKHKRLAELIEI